MRAGLSRAIEELERQLAGTVMSKFFRGEECMAARRALEEAIDRLRVLRDQA